MSLIIVNKRVDHTEETTLGIMKIGHKPIGFVIEDEPRAVKVKGETRIPAGSYKFGIRKVDSPLTLRYRERFDWFKYHIELLDVPGFDYVYVHVGNDEGDTDACQVIGYNAHVRNFDYVNSQSVDMYKDFYDLVYPLLEKGNEVIYKIIDD